MLKLYEGVNLIKFVPKREDIRSIFG